MSVPNLVAGTIVGGKYAIKSLLGRSPVAATYHAHTAPNREVALKVFDSATRSRPDIIASLRETAIAARELPNHVATALLDDGLDEGLGAPFIVSELCATPPLGQLVSLCPLAPPETLSVIQRLATALDLAHANGLHHLDLKPSNVFVGPPPHYAVRLSDFAGGLRTSVGSTVGSLAWAIPWLAPEQVDDPRAGDARTDVFAMGLLTFFALTGHSYWRSCEGPPDAAAWRAEVAAPRVPASARAAECRVLVVAGLDGALARALDPDPSQRFATPGELARALASAVAGGSATPHVDADWEMAPSLRLPVAPAVPRPPLRSAPRVAVASPASEPALPTFDPRGSEASLPAFDPRASESSLPRFPADGPAISEVEHEPVDEAPPMAPASPAKRRTPLLVAGAALAVLGTTIAIAVAVLSRGARPTTPSRSTAAAEPPATQSTAPAPAPTPTGERPDVPTPAASTRPAASTEPARTAPPTADTGAEPLGDGGSIEISCTPACVKTLIDKEPVTSTGPVRLPAGPHVISVAAANGRTKLVSINLKPGRAEKMIFQLGASGACGKPRCP